MHLVAAIQLIQNTYLCGYAPCGAVIDHVLLWVTGHGLLFTGLALALVLLTPTLLVPLYRQHVNCAAEKYISDRIHMPYGEQHYFHRETRRVVRPVIHGGQEVVLTDFGRPVARIIPYLPTQTVSPDEARSGDLEDAAILAALEESRDDQSEPVAP